MSVAIVSGSLAYQYYGVATPVTLSYTISASDANTMLVVLVHNSKKACTISSVTWNGTALTLVGEKEGSSYHRVSAYRLLNPGTGTANIIITYSANPSYGTLTEAFLLTGVNASTPTSDLTTANGTGAASSVVIPNCASADLELAISGCEYMGSSHTTTTGTTILNYQGNNWADTGSAYNTGSGSVTIAFSHTSAEYCILGFRVVAAATTVTIGSVDSGSQSQAGNEASPTQTQALGSVDSGAQTNVAATPTASQVQKLAAEPGTQAQVAETPAVAQVQVLDAEPGVQAQASATPGMTQVQVIEAEAGSQSQAADQPALTQIQALVSVDPGYQSQFADEVILIQTPAGFIPFYLSRARGREMVADARPRARTARADGRERRPETAGRRFVVPLEARKRIRAGRN